MNHRIIKLFVFLVSFSVFGQQTPNETFETTSVPSSWTATNGILTTSTAHYKNPAVENSKSLKWAWNSNSVLTVSNLSKNTKVSNKTLFRIWVYNEVKAPGKKIDIEFQNSNGVKQYYYSMNLNFTGWRAASMHYEDMSLIDGAATSYQKIQIKSPTSGSGDLFFDFIEYNAKTETKRAPDYQLTSVVTTVGDPHWEDMIRFQNLPKVFEAIAPTDIEKNNFAAVKDSYIDYLEKLSYGELSKADVLYDDLKIKYVNNIIYGLPLFGNIDPKNFLYLDKVEAFLLTYAGDFIENGTPTSKEKFLNTIRYLLDQGYAEGSLQETVHHIGYSFRKIPSAVFLMETPLRAENLWDEATKMVEWFVAADEIWEPTASYSNMDEGNTRSIQKLGSCLFKATENERIQYLKGYKYWMENWFSFRSGEGQGIKPDFLGFHHNTFYPGYAYIAYANMSKCAEFLGEGGATFQLSMAKKELYTKMIKTARVASTSDKTLNARRPTVFPNSIAGRHPFDGQTIRGAIKNLGLTKPRNESILEMHNYLYTSDSETVNSGTETAPNGFWQFNYANMGIYRKSDWMVAVKGFNKYFWGTEIYKTENRYGRYQSYGAVEVFYKGGQAPSKRSIDGFNWNIVPGTTTEHFREKTVEGTTYSNYDLVALKDRQDEKTNSNFAASLKIGKKTTAYIDDKIEGTSGVFGMDFVQDGNISATHTSSFKFKKSVFCFDGKLLCLGSNINNTDPTNITATNLYQTFISSNTETYVNNSIAVTGLGNSKKKTLSSGSNWLIDAAGTGYYIKAGDPIVVERKTQSSPDERNNFGIDKTYANTSGEFATAYIDHGKTFVDKGYEYVIVPKTTPVVLAQLSSDMSNVNTAFYKVLQKDQTAHIVEKGNTSGYVLFASGNYSNTSPLKSNDVPCLVMTEKVSEDYMNVSVVNPDMNFTVYPGNFNDQPSNSSTITLVVEGAWETMNGNLGVVVMLDGNGTTTTLEVQAADGLPNEISLRKPGAESNPNPGIEEIVYYEDFGADDGRGFSKHTVNTGGQISDQIIRRIGDVVGPDGITPDDSDNLFSGTRPSMRIPIQTVRSQRAVKWTGTGSSINYGIDAYLILTTVDLTTANSLIKSYHNKRYLSFWSKQKYAVGGISQLEVYVSTSYIGSFNSNDSTNVTSQLMGEIATSGVKSNIYVESILDLSAYNNSNVTIAIRYKGGSDSYSTSKKNGTFLVSDPKFYVKDMAVLGIDTDEVPRNSMRVYPNPVKDVLYIDYNGIQVKRVFLSSMTGQKIYESDDVAPIHVENYRKGMYVLTIQTENNTISKLVVLK